MRWDGGSGWEQSGAQEKGSEMVTRVPSMHCVAVLQSTAHLPPVRRWRGAADGREMQMKMHAG